MNIFLALAAEHKARTGHDIHTQTPLDTTHMNCLVCLHLWSEKRDLEKAEAEFYLEEQRRDDLLHGENG